LKLSDYEVRLYQNRLLGMWGWVAKAPNGDELVPIGMTFTKEAAEAQAVVHIERHAAGETIDGERLKKRVTQRREALGLPATQGKAR
jgi:hypothetical protein